MSDKLPVIVSTTSWKDRINTVGKTIYSVVRNCNPEKVCLTLSSDEFPGKENDLPQNLLGFVESKMLDIIWIEKNIKCFKKILFAMQKYPEYPIVSADDDCLYTENYAKFLYQHWLTDKSSIWSLSGFIDYKNRNYVHGPSALYPPNCFKDIGIKYLGNKLILSTWHDDVFYSVLAWRLGINIKIVYSKRKVYVFHDCVNPLSREMTASIPIAVKVCLNEIQ